jgi:hypothetical protein
VYVQWLSKYEPELWYTISYYPEKLTKEEADREIAEADRAGYNIRISRIEH